MGIAWKTSESDLLLLRGLVMIIPSQLNYLVFTLMLVICSACSNSDDKLGDVAFITHSDTEIDNLQFTDEKGYVQRVGYMPVPGGLKLNMFVRLPTGDTGKLTWTQNGVSHNRDVDLKSLDIRPPGMLALILNHDDLITTYVKYERMKNTEDGFRRRTPVIKQYYDDVPAIKEKYARRKQMRENRKSEQTTGTL